MAATVPASAASGQLPPPEVLGGLSWRFIATHDTCWDPSEAMPTLNLRLDGRVVPSAFPNEGCARVSFSHVVVLDNFIGEPEREALMTFLTGSSDNVSDPAGQGTSSQSHTGLETAGGGSGTPTMMGVRVEGQGHVDGGGEGITAGPGPKWERATADRAGLAATWGLKVRQDPTQ